MIPRIKLAHYVADSFIHQEELNSILDIIYSSAYWRRSALEWDDAPCLFTRYGLCFQLYCQSTSRAEWRVVKVLKHFLCSFLPADFEWYDLYIWPAEQEYRPHCANLCRQIAYELEACELFGQ